MFCGPTSLRIFTFLSFYKQKEIIYIYIYILLGVQNFIKFINRPNLFMLKDKIEQLTGFGPTCSQLN